MVTVVTSACNQSSQCSAAATVHSAASCGSGASWKILIYARIAGGSPDSAMSAQDAYLAAPESWPTGRSDNAEAFADQRRAVGLWARGERGTVAWREGRVRACSVASVALRLRPMVGADLAAVQAWLGLPHVARWWTPDTTAGAKIAQYRQRISGDGDTATVMLTVTDDGAPIGWCQWYRWSDYPAEAAAMGAREGEVGIDYAIGDPSRVGRGVGSQLIAALVAEVRRHHPGAGLLSDPDAANVASRRVLEKNGFELVAVRPVVTEPNDRPMAIYRLTGQPSPSHARPADMTL